MDPSLSVDGVVRHTLKIGVISSVTAHLVKVNLAHAGDVSGHYTESNRYGRGEVGELVLIEGQQCIILGRIIEVNLPDKDRNEISQDFDGLKKVDAIGFIQMLGSINSINLKVQAGISAYPRLGDRVFSAPSELISRLPELTNEGLDSEVKNSVKLELGVTSGDTGCKISVTPEKLFGRHCAILGSTGGGKSWTTAKIIQECRRYKSKVILLDATGEYRSTTGGNVSHYHLGTPLHKADGSVEIRIPPTNFNESDFIALFEPSGKVQGPKLREAIKSLRLARLAPDFATDGVFLKIRQPKENYYAALKKDRNSTLIDDPSQPFDIRLLIKQIEQECCYPDDSKKPKHWGNESGELAYCASLLTRIMGVRFAKSLECIFTSNDMLPSLVEQMEKFVEGDKSIMRICLSSIGYEFNAREVIANAIGRILLTKARNEAFKVKPLVVILDEAHNFLGKKIGSEDISTKLDAFELIAKEGRKYGLTICLATQRPRDITEGVLSQMGTLLVHRLTNDRDREVVERACGEIDRSAAAFLPNLKQGEVALVGVDFPIPVTIQIDKPAQPPMSDGPSYQNLW
ncbi:hypothetical protein PS718_02641 [Pseudomonas fluorescens]|uniref:AAA+ ATPase domain-containing protein n=1 Tax=Pseudomonas fluorescens TaxID=294 RepID=A0A5E7CLQ0_PSEFL|nr:ATP-binding protein [Pseudomonas fluorescens]VVO00745.1 hypothetical protein PS718_02641 [Pseudomonas fluorescens]